MLSCLLIVVALLLPWWLARLFVGVPALLQFGLLLNAERRAALAAFAAFAHNRALLFQIKVADTGVSRLKAGPPKAKRAALPPPSQRRSGAWSSIAGPRAEERSGSTTAWTAASENGLTCPIVRFDM